MESFKILKELGSPIELIGAAVLFYLAWRVYFSIRIFLDDQKKEFDEAITKMLLKSDFLDFKNEFHSFRIDVAQQLRENSATLNQCVGKIEAVNKKSTS